MDQQPDVRALSPEQLTELVRKLTDEGKLVEAGWIGLCLAIMPTDAPAIQVREMRKAFFAGAQHVFSSILAVMDDDREPTEADMRRMTNISDELTKFADELRVQIQGKGH